MKTKILLITLLSIFIFSCNSDDETSVQNPSSEKLIKTINIDGILIEYLFNEDNTVQKLEISNGLDIAFNYTEGRISSLNGGNIQCEFQYDADGRIKSFTKDALIDVTYNSATRTYTYEDGKEYTIVLTENNDIKEYQTFDPQTEETTSIEYFYEESKNGALTNSNDIAACLVISFNYIDIGIYASKKPVQTFNNGGYVLSFENTYDSEGFVVKSIVEDDDIFYSYNQ